jgi:hypothetical protein
LELQEAFEFQTFGLPRYRAAVPWLAEVALQTDKGVVLLQALMGHLRRQGILLPAVPVLERLSAEALTRDNRQLYQLLTEDLILETRQALENLLTRREGSSLTRLAWLRQVPSAPTARQMLVHWEEILRLATSIKQGTVTASLMLRKLGSYSRQNGLAIALRDRAASSEPIHPGLAAKRGLAPPCAGRAQQRRSPQRAGPGRLLPPAG